MTQIRFILLASALALVLAGMGIVETYAGIHF